MNNIDSFFVDWVGIVGVATGLIALVVSIMAYCFQSRQATADRRVVLRQVHARLTVALDNAIDNAASAIAATQAAFSAAGKVDSTMAVESIERINNEISTLNMHSASLQEVDPHNDSMSSLLIEDCLVDYAFIEENLRLVVTRHNEIILRALEEARLLNRTAKVPRQ